MKIVVIGGTGLIGKKVVVNLRQHGHDVVAAAPSSRKQKGSGAILFGSIVALGGQEADRHPGRLDWRMDWGWEDGPSRP
jgi:uncharacterized protein YbjT (DUF2867 family)